MSCFSASLKMHVCMFTYSILIQVIIKMLNDIVEETNKDEQGLKEIIERKREKERI